MTLCVNKSPLDQASSGYRVAGRGADALQMRIGRRPPSTSNPGSSLPLRAQALVPFALALALVVGLAAIGAALVARSAVDRELRAQAETARHLVSGRLDQIEQRLTAEVDELADDAPAQGGRRRLEEQVIHSPAGSG